MINLVQNINLINTFNKHTIPSFTGKTNDMFIKSGGNMDKEYIYTPTDKTINIDDIKAKYTKKTAMLPLIMDRVMGSIGAYINQQRDAKEFSKQFLDGASSLATRISIGKDSEEYCENYAPELKMIKGISPICNDYVNGEVTLENLNSGVESKVAEYVNDGTVRKKHFVR